LVVAVLEFTVLEKLALEVAGPVVDVDDSDAGCRSARMSFMGLDHSHVSGVGVLFLGVS
jgi:hypothetical protein